MTSEPAVSIAICTRNRAAALAATLASVARTTIPPELAVELLVVDNGSTDDTPAVVADFSAPSGVLVRSLRVAERGVARARNAALRAAGGRIIVYLDDDVRPGPRWLEPLCAPILAGRADAVAGGIRLAPHLERPWMTRRHRVWLASTEALDPGAPEEMLSANMAIGRHVLEKVASFDVELGSGALGYGEDALFSQQLLRAGFRIASAFDATVEHHVDPTRLSRAAFREAAAQRGRTLAYRRHHWEHLDVPDPARRLRRRRLRLALGRLAHPLAAAEGMPEWEMLLREDVAFLRQWCVERVRPRNYERRGLVKRAGVAA
jgi:glycosyltransferase involved in cell wall biosynthesis